MLTDNRESKPYSSYSPGMPPSYNHAPDIDGSNFELYQPKSSYEPFEVSDIERLQFLFCGEFSINVELWDTAGEEKYNE